MVYILLCAFSPDECVIALLLDPLAQDVAAGVSVPKVPGSVCGVSCLLEFKSENVGIG